MSAAPGSFVAVPPGEGVGALLVGFGVIGGAMVKERAGKGPAKRERGLKQLPDGRWQWSFVDPHGIYHRFIAATKTEAKGELEAARTMIREKRYLNVKAECKTYFEDAVKQFLEWSEGNTRPATYQGDKWCTDLWKESPHLMGKRVDKITAQDVERFRQGMAQKKKIQQKKGEGDIPHPDQVMGKRALDYALARLKRLFNLCKDWGLIATNPADPVKLYREDIKRVRYLSEEEERALIGAAMEDSTPFLYRIIRFALNTGMRKGEILGMRWEDVDFKNASAVIPAPRAKGRRDRYVPLNTEAMAVLREIPTPLDRSAVVFGNTLGRPQQCLERHWRRALVASGVEDFHFHDLRHTYASRLITRGVDLAVLKELLGHRDFTMTLRYAHLAPSALKSAVMVLEKPKPAANLQSETKRPETESQAFPQVVTISGN